MDVFHGFIGREDLDHCGPEVVTRITSMVQATSAQERTSMREAVEQAWTQFRSMLPEGAEDDTALKRSWAQKAGVAAAAAAIGAS